MTLQATSKNVSWRGSSPVWKSCTLVFKGGHLEEKGTRGIARRVSIKLPKRKTEMLISISTGTLSRFGASPPPLHLFHLTHPLHHLLLQKASLRWRWRLNWTPSPNLLILLSISSSSWSLSSLPLNKRLLFTLPPHQPDMEMEVALELLPMIAKRSLLHNSQAASLEILEHFIF